MNVFFFLGDTEVFRVKKSNHSKKIVKQLKKEYKEDLEKSVVPEPVTNTDGKKCFHIFTLSVSVSHMCLNNSSHQSK